MNRCRFEFCVIVILAMSRVSTAADADDSQLVRRMLEPFAKRTALCVHLGVRDGQFAAKLSDGGRILVNGLCADADALDVARQQIDAMNLTGSVSVETTSFEKLPHSDRIANLVVVDDLPQLLELGLNLGEVSRVLAPGGVAWIGQRSNSSGKKLTRDRLDSVLRDDEFQEFEIIEEGGLWAKVVKPRSTDLGAWTHPRHDASGNPVSKDKQIGIPNGVRWVAGPNWPTGYRKSAVPRVVASEKRLVYVFQDEVETADGLNRRDSLIVRDAFNGLRLWKKEAHSSLLVSVGDRVYTAVGSNQKLTALDGDTGETLHVYAAEDLKELAYADGLLVANCSEGLVCLEAERGARKWSVDAKAKKFVVADGRVFFHSDAGRRGGDSVLGCLDLKTGRQFWTASTKEWAKASIELVLYYDGTLVAAGKTGTHGISADDGSHLWLHEYPLIGHGGKYSKVMAMDGLMWVHASGFEGGSQYAWEGLDVRTGKVRKRLVQPKSFRYKHRCSYDVGTDGLFMCGSMDFADLRSGEYRHFEGARNSCATAGLVPANGLIYTFPHACGCYPMLRGFLGLATTKLPEMSSYPNQDESLTPTDRLQRGPAYDGARTSEGFTSDDWPTYRYDPRRTSGTTAPGPEKLNRLWQRTVAEPQASSLLVDWVHKDGGRVTAPVVASGMAFVAATDRQRMMAFDAATGEERWSYVAAGRIDCPPTIADGLCLFGARDGWVYCLRAEDGRLVWRFRAAPVDRRIVAYGQLESPWPVVGGVLVYDGLAYFAVGRHADSDGGVYVQAVERETGKLVWARKPEGYAGVPDVLNGDNGSIQMASWQFDAKTGKDGDTGDTRLRGGRLGLLNDAWYRRPIATRKSLQSWTGSGLSAGQLLAFDASQTFGFKAPRVDGGRGTLSGPSQLFSAARKDSSNKSWSLELPTTARLKGLVVTPERLYAAGRFEAGDSAPYIVRAYAAGEGKLIDEYVVGQDLVHDCLAVAGDRLYVSTQTGKLICLAAR